MEKSVSKLLEYQEKIDREYLDIQKEYLAIEKENLNVKKNALDMLNRIINQE